MDSLLIMCRNFLTSDNIWIELLKIIGSILGGLCGIFSAVRLVRRYLRARKRKQFIEETRTPEKAIETLKAALMENLQYVKKLTTVEKFVEGKIPFKKVRQFLSFNVGTNECTLTYKGKITCGCDLQQIRFEPSENISGGVKVLSPHCRIIDAFVDINTIEIHYEKKSTLLPPEITLEEQTAVIKDDFEKKKQLNIDEGILEIADDKVRDMLMKLSGNKKIEVEIIFYGENKTLSQLNPPNQENSEI